MDSWIDAKTSASMVYKDAMPPWIVEFDNGVTLNGAMPYARIEGYRPLTLDLYLPPSPRRTSPSPLLIYIHGGGWRRGDSHRSGVFSDFPRLLAEIAARGYAVASINYRLSAEARWPAQLEDAKAALHYLAGMAEDLQIDTTNTYVWGVSAGAHIAASLGNPWTDRDSRAARPGPGALKVQAVAVWYGVFCLQTLQYQAERLGLSLPPQQLAPESQLLGYPPGSSDVPEGASPALEVSNESAPTLILVGEKDEKVPYLQSIQLKEALETANVPHHLIVYADVGHSFICHHDSAITHETNLNALNTTIQFFDARAFNSNLA
ncbi:alpha/beta hydrolase fold domain-containing protein [Pseudomonas sp. NyZ201]|uniref:alpha/beta hydrolase fold domain-containing protein n=1 Tax=Pseudomonas sp. NyZ201 TaxID=3409857 RepID=UPI003CEC6AC8